MMIRSTYLLDATRDLQEGLKFTKELSFVVMGETFSRTIILRHGQFI